MKKLCLYLSLLLVGLQNVTSQVIDSLDMVQIDSLKTQRDDKFYKDAGEYLKKRKLTQKIYDFLFTKPKVTTPQTGKVTDEINFKPHQGKIIRNIEIITLDPFGYSEKDLSKKPGKKLEIYGNALHNKTKRGTVKKQLLFSKNDRLDSLLVQESERILRDQNYIRRVVIRPIPITPVSDSIDIQVVALDSWTMFFDSDWTDKRGWIRVSEYNLFGIGHQLSLTYRQYFKKFSENGKGIYYRARNIENTHIDGIASYYQDLEEYSGRLVLDRPLFSPYARWTGRIAFYENRQAERMFVNDSLLYPYIKYRIYDTYGGYAIPLKNSDDKSIHRAIISARYKQTKFLETPVDSLNVGNFYSDEELFLSKLSLNSTRFVQDRYIFRHGDIEDVSIGHSFFGTSGVSKKNLNYYPYLGIGASWANYTDKGYFSIDTEAGGFLSNGRAHRVAIKGELSFFSNLFTLGNWYFREFAKAQFVMGFNRATHINDKITINEKEGMKDFDSNIYDGTRKLLLVSQTQLYSPFHWYGFRISPFLNVELGIIGREHTSFFNVGMYPKFAIGFYISNDYLLFHNFQFSFCYFPEIPGVGNNIYEITNSRNDDFRLPSFGHNAPSTILFK